MKKILFVFFLGIVVSCKETLTEHPAIRRIVNETEFEVRIEVFGHHTNKLMYDIASLDSIDIEGVCTSGIETYCGLGWWGTSEFGRIYFNNDKVQIFGLLAVDVSEKFINADPIGGRYGYIRSEENGTRVYTYRITQEDYDNAELIGG